MLDLNSFISCYVTKRETSMFDVDIANNREKLWQAIEGKSFLVIGGAGSIGSNFIKAVLPYKPASLVVVDTNENALTEITRSLRSDVILSRCIPDIYITYPMDYSSDVFRKMFLSHKRRDSIGFDIVANFAAHKHVRSEKDIYSIEALFRNNLINLYILLDLLKQYPPELYFCVSTDKAANPVNLMGASKRVMEDLIFSYSDHFKVTTARFANVAFSNGSLPDGFIKRINLRQPLSAPTDIRRYFVSLQESGQICMLSSMLGANREIFFPKLWEASTTTFDAIAVDLLHAYGYDVCYCESDTEAIEKSKVWNDGLPYPVHFSASDTSGEKGIEEFFTDSEITDINRYKALGVITEKEIPDRESIKELIKKLEKEFDNISCTKEHVVEIIGDYLGNFNHMETGKSLDLKM